MIAGKPTDLILPYRGQNWVMAKLLTTRMYHIGLKPKLASANACPSVSSTVRMTAEGHNTILMTRPSLHTNTRDTGSDNKKFKRKR